MKYKEKETNGFETSIFGIDLFLKWIYKKIKANRTKKRLQ